MPERNGSPPLLRVTDLRTGYGQVPVLHGISFDVRAGETAVVLGLNGAGKSTTVLALAGALPVWSGRVELDGHDVTGWSVARRVREGIVLVPEGRHVFPELSVDANLAVGAWSRRDDAGWVEGQRDVVFGYFPRLAERREQAAGSLSGGEQQMLAIARALMARPRILMIDEASLGLAPRLVEEVFRIVRQINDDGTTVVLVEQNVAAAQIADVGVFLQQGTVTAVARGDELHDAAGLRALYLG